MHDLHDLLNLTSNRILFIYSVVQREASELQKELSISQSLPYDRLSFSAQFNASRERFEFVNDLSSFLWDAYQSKLIEEKEEEEMKAKREL